jgi:tetratricopeptide (TPR) repeat protein
MMSCIFILYIALFQHPESCGIACGLAAETMSMQGSGQGSTASDPEALFANRADLESARGAVSLWEARLAADSRDFTSAARLARAFYWLGTHAPDAERKSLLEKGIAAGRTAITLDPNRPEGHFWLAANMGALAESFGLLQGLKYRGEIRDELVRVLQLDPGFQSGSADRALGRWYYKVPGLFGGSNAKSEEHLRRSLTYAPENTASLYFLAETLIAMKRRTEAAEVLQKLIASPGDPGWAPEDREYKARAQRLLGTLEKR